MRIEMIAPCQKCGGTKEVVSDGCDCPSACTEDCPACVPPVEEKPRPKYQWQFGSSDAEFVKGYTIRHPEEFE